MARVAHKILTAKPKRKVSIVRSKITAGRKKSTKTAKNKKRPGADNIVRGKEVTIKESASSRQVVYGKFRIGGVLTFIDTSSDSYAYLTTGSGNSTINWTAKVAGAAGNSITVTIVVSGTYGTLDCSVAGNDITIRCKSTSGTSISTAAEVIAKVKATPSAHALVAVNKEGGDGTGIVTAVSITNLVQGGGTWLHQFITLAGHQIQGIQSLYLDNREVTLGASPDPRWGTGIWANKVFLAFQPGTDDQEAQPDLMAQVPAKWTSTHRQRGCAGAYLITVWDQNVFAEGFPEIEFLVFGKLVYDPRTLTTVYSANSALIVADFLTNERFGFGIPWANIDTDALIAAADICDQTVALAGGGTEARYETACSFDTDQSKEQILEELLAAMDGFRVEQGGKHFIYAGAYRTPTITLTEDDLRGPVSIHTHVSRSDSFNCIRGTFVDPKSNYNETDIPVVKNATYISQDGGKEAYEDVALNMVTQSCQAQRLLKINLERVRQGLTCKFPAKLTAFNVAAGDTVNVSLSEFGWSPKVFEAEQVNYAIEEGGAIGFDLDLRETASAIHDWNSGLETTVDIAPNTNLPDPTNVAEPTNVTLASGTAELDKRLDGTIWSRLKVSWDDSSTEFVVFGGKFEIQYKKHSSSTWSQSFTVPGYTTFQYITDVQDGVSYDVRVRAVNTIEFASDWVEVLNHTVLGKSAPPSDVTGFTYTVTDDGIKLTWTDITDLDRSKYEIRVGASWAGGTVIARLDSSDGTAYTYQYRTAGTITIRIKAIDTSKNYSTNDATVTVTLTGPSPINNFSVKTVGTSVLLDWNDPTPSTFSVNQYDVYKGDDFDSAAKLGTVFGTFHAYVERLGGTFTYWIVAIDIGGNRSTEVSSQGTVTPPDDYFIQSDQNPLPEYTSYLNAVIGGSTLAPDEPNDEAYLPVPTSVASASGLWLMLLSSSGGDETFESWWDNNGWNSLQDAIDDGFVEWLQPGTTTPGYIEMLIDYGLVFSSSFIDWSWTETVLGDPTSITPTISVSEDNLSYTDYVGATQVFASDFRYVRLRLDFTGSSNFSLSRLSDFRVTISLQREEEVGLAEVFAADHPSGTVVTFVKDFLDVEDIQLTTDGTDPAYPVLNFNDIANPPSFKILLFDDSGNPTDGFVRYRVRGAVNP